MVTATTPPSAARRAARVLLVAQPTIGGVGRFVGELAAAGRDAGFDVVVASPAEGDLPRWTQALGARWVEMPLLRQPHASDVRCIGQLRHLARAADLVHLHSSKAGAVGRLALATLGSNRPPSVFTPHAWSWYSGGPLAPAYRAFERASAPVSSAIVAVSRDEAEAGKAVLARAGRRIQVIEPGIELSRFDSEGPAAPRLSQPLLVCVGELRRQKGQDLAVNALALMRDRQARLRFVGAGPNEQDGIADGISREELRRLATDLGVAERLEFRGQREDVGAELRAADLLIMPSRWEGLSKVLLEAMACGVPIVATRVAGTDVIEGAGVLVAREDPGALARAIDDLLEDGERRRDLGQAGRRKAPEFSLARSMQRNILLWERLLRSCT